MTIYEDKRDEYLADAKVHCKRAEYFAALNVTGVILTAALAALAAVTSLTSVPSWMTTAAAALSAALGILTAAFKPLDKSAAHTQLAADLKRLSSEFRQLAEWQGPMPTGDWAIKLAGIENLLAANKQVPDEATWAAAWPPVAPAPTA
ncbi:hypothetical protein FHX52_0505 [Humibacillus xanthopallidus]|uniref:SMODS and SLOG-associating 2TM effector domain-containing protein n=2 Tax=Humibacillus xanthopallidus TaxID=412689 RepID=A0A543PTL6_9MICO|nr:hypothetical protein FHX52_0505 [Humibacillus xanthopallidus]